jgi:hypothetical protein
MPKLAVTLVSFAGPEGKFASVVLGEIFGALMPGPSVKNVEDVVMMAVEKLETFISSQFDDVEVRDAGAHISTAYDWFQTNYERAKVDKDAVTRSAAVFMDQVDDALGPNSQLGFGIAKLSDPRYRYLGVNMLATGIGLKLTLSKIQMIARNDLSTLPAVKRQISNYMDTVKIAKQEAEMYGLKQLQGLSGDAFIARRDQLVQQLYQGDDSVCSYVQWRLGRALMDYDQWTTS